MFFDSFKRNVVFRPSGLSAFSHLSKVPFAWANIQNTWKCEGRGLEPVHKVKAATDLFKDNLFGADTCGWEDGSHLASSE